MRISRYLQLGGPNLPLDPRYTTLHGLVEKLAWVQDIVGRRPNLVLLLIREELERDKALSSSCVRRVNTAGRELYSLMLGTFKISSESTPKVPSKAEPTPKSPWVCLLAASHDMSVISIRNNNTEEDSRGATQRPRMRTLPSPGRLDFLLR